jgi:molybdopterin molybdotransferase
VTFALFAAPLIRAMQGDRVPLPMLFPARLRAGIRHKPGRTEFVRATLDADSQGLWVTPLVNQASGATTTSAWADALAVVPLGSGDLETGALVQVLRVADV